MIIYDSVSNWFNTVFKQFDHFLFRNEHSRAKCVVSKLSCNNLCQMILKCFKKLWLKQLWCKNPLNFTWNTMKFHNCTHAMKEMINSWLKISVDYGAHPQHWLLFDRLVQQIVLQSVTQEDPDLTVMDINVQDIVQQ